MRMIGANLIVKPWSSRPNSGASFMCEMMNLGAVDLIVVSLLRKINLSFIRWIVDLMVVSLHVYVCWVGRPNVGGPLNHNNLMLMKLIYVNLGYTLREYSYMEVLQTLGWISMNVFHIPQQYLHIGPSYRFIEDRGTGLPKATGPHGYGVVINHRISYTSSHSLCRLNAYPHHVWYV